ncbi:putative glycosyl transferase [Microcystis aeruginosa NIES-3787]|uniref:Putative glycosyl transferase n=1 Tax=Microcystis aeruginosa NIES-3787 TaxID=2517782 RepID=A0A6H9GEA2_MICAE|nr:putative glycosyl transferase [Microcystis aeruginosa NIES-3787]
MWHAIRRGSLVLLGMALDLSVPPLALLATLVIGLLGGCAGLWAWTGDSIPITLMAAELALFAAAILIAWYQVGRNAISFMQLLSVPWYVFSKVPMYAVFLVKRQAEWVRTRRSGE